MCRTDWQVKWFHVSFFFGGFNQTDMTCRHAAIHRMPGPSPIPAAAPAGGAAQCLPVVAELEVSPHSDLLLRYEMLQLLDLKLRWYVHAYLLQDTCQPEASLLPSRVKAGRSDVCPQKPTAFLERASEKDNCQASSRWPTTQVSAPHRCSGAF